MRSTECACWPPQLREIEEACKAHVGKALGVFSKEVPLAQAQAIFGLRAVFGEVRNPMPCTLLKSRKVDTWGMYT